MHSVFENPPLGPIQKEIARENHYIPTYENVPDDYLNFRELALLAQRRNSFHRRIEFESDQKPLDFVSLRSISVDFGIPIKKFANCKHEIETDHASFYSLMIASLKDEQSIKKFAINEARLLYYRLRTSSVSPVQIDEYFWPSNNIRNLIISNMDDNDEAKINFNDIILIFKPYEIYLKDGYVIISLDDIHRLVSRVFKKKLINKMKLIKDDSLLIKENDLTIPLHNELDNSNQKKANLKLEELSIKCERSFPPCMYRILTNVIKTGKTTFKGRLELSLFMKSLGIDYFEQYKFWSTVLLQKGGVLDEWYFESQVVLMLKQIYGLDDSERSFAPHRCITIINHDNPMTNKMIQGCPFKFMDSNNLKVFLKKMRRKKIKQNDIESITKSASTNPTYACKEFFNKTFYELPLSKTDIESPTMFYIESELRLKL